MDRLYKELKKEIDLLKEENKALRNSHPQKERESNAPRSVCREYQTDEEELELETNHNPEKRASKKRRAGSSPEIEPQDECQRKKRQVGQPKAKQRPPPPINVVGITDYNKLHCLLKGSVSSEFKVKSFRNNAWKINVDDSDGYRAVSQKLNNEKIQWYTFENKSERPLRVIARGLHPSCTKEDIMNDLQAKGFKILDAINIIRKEKQQTEIDQKTYVKRGLPLFMLSFDKTDNIDEIYKINSILNIVVKIEPMRRNTRQIPQCKRCQGYNHTQLYCKKDPRCVKCAGNHLSKDCKVNKETSAICINCNGKHPANYRGCEVAKELQKRRDAFLRPQNNITKPTNREKSKTAQSKVVKEKPSVREARKVRERVPKEKPSTSIPKKGIEKLQVKTPKRSGQQTSGVQTYAQAAASAKEKVETSTDPVSHVFSVILEKLEEQSKINKIILDRLIKLENNSGNTRT